MTPRTCTQVIKWSAEAVQDSTSADWPASDVTLFRKMESGNEGKGYYIDVSAFGEVRWFITPDEVPAN